MKKQLPDAGPRSIAVVDIGTNTVKYSVFQLETHTGAIWIVDSWAETIRIGAGLEASGRIEQTRLDRAADSLKSGEQRARYIGAESFIGVATAALRRAANGPELMARIAVETRWSVRIIGGDEEARLTFLGLQESLSPNANSLVVDIGGGSTEVIRTEGETLLDRESIAIGSTVMADRLFSHAPPLWTELEQVVIQSTDSLSAIISTMAVQELNLILSGGTGLLLLALNQHLRFGKVLTRTSIESTLLATTTLPAGQLASILKITAERAGVLPAGIAIARAFVEIANPTVIEVRPSGIRTGLLFDHLDRTRPGRNWHQLDRVAQSD